MSTNRYNPNDWNHYRHAGVQQRAVRHSQYISPISGPYSARPLRKWRGLLGPLAFVALTALVVTRLLR